MMRRTAPLSASSALAMTSRYQRGKSVACGLRTGAGAGYATGERGGRRVDGRQRATETSSSSVCRAPRSRSERSVSR